MISTIVITTLFVYGISIVVNGIAQFFNIDIDDIYARASKILRFVMHPTIYCNVCMSSFWGTIGYVMACESFDTGQWLLTCVISAGLINIYNQYNER